MDLASILGLVVGFGGILVGNMLEGGHIDSLLQATAALIVLGGTMGAVMVSNTMADLKRGMKYMTQVFLPKHDNYEEKVNEIVNSATIAKRESVLALEKNLEKIENPFFKDVLALVIDGIDPKLIREIFETRIYMQEQEVAGASKVWTDAGGFAPTIGIIGAVLGLIHVMGNLSDPSKLGAGIAVAFVATVYGVGSANLLFLPMGNKIKKMAQHASHEKEAYLEGALMIGAGVNAKIILEKLKSYGHVSEEKKA